MPLDQDFINSVRPAIHVVWGAIGDDAMPLLDDDNEAAVEMCFDADRISLYCRNNEAEKIIHTAIAVNGYDKVLKYLSEHIHLV